MHEGVQRIRIVGAVAGVGVFFLVIVLGARKGSIGIPELLLALVAGLVVWGVMRLIAWLTEGFTKKKES
jgi:high-affinity Fe2+/Pb2+ permease